MEDEMSSRASVSAILGGGAASGGVTDIPHPVSSVEGATSFEHRREATDGPGGIG